MHIVEATLRQTWQRLFGPEITAFLVDDQWPSLLFVPDLEASRPTPARKRAIFSSCSLSSLTPGTIKVVTS